jgi:hypothetical protein
MKLAHRPDHNETTMGVIGARANGEGGGPPSQGIKPIFPEKLVAEGKRILREAERARGGLLGGPGHT